ncbi:hypothetical protein VTN49DRAFT_4693 [Thermomyces lanuginosus]|uniref:uncharacterized protein n=1 Tax=Thermomyces lanuginosus TaxID=5541 RepID=UPI003742D9FF
MPSTTCHLPNGHTFTVTPVFGGVAFKSHDLNVHNSVFPPGWTVVIHTETDAEDAVEESAVGGDAGHENGENENSSRDAGGNTQNDSTVSTAAQTERKRRIVRFTRPTLRDDCLFISAISNPPSSEFKPPSSPSRQIAMMLWATLWWYFHEPEPELRVTTDASSATPLAGRPKADWRVNIKREGIFQGRNLMQKLERMGLIANEDSSVGLDSLEARNPAGWERMFVSRRSFWQLDPRIFLFSLTPAHMNTVNSVLPGAYTPGSSRPASPSLDALRSGEGNHGTLSGEGTPHCQGPGPYTTGSRLPTYYPPPPTQFVFTNGVRHPLRQRPPHQGETFYVRYIPSVGQYFSLRVPVLNSSKQPLSNNAPHLSSLLSRPQSPSRPSDLELLHKWMNNPRVNAAWGEAGSMAKHEQFLKDALTSRHSFPVFGCWDGKPFGYFEIYWVKEDKLGRLLPGSVGNYDRGLHVLVGEEDFRGAHRVPLWLSSLVHYCWLADPRTETVILEPRVDNVKLIKYLTDLGFYKEGEVSFPHKQAAVMKIKRDYWEAPAV